MALFVRDVQPGSIWKDQWRLPTRPHFMGSQAYEVLKRELQRYARDEVRGRSFLISGHRGVGKTTLVLRAIEDVADETIERAMDTFAVDPSAERPRRPLLVKLHGPSLLTLELPTPGGGETPSGTGKVSSPPAPPPGGKPPSDASGAQSKRAAAGGEQAGTNTAAANVEKPAADGSAAAVNKAAAGRPKAADTAHAALVQITIALYRALAGEVAETFANHARIEKLPPRRGEPFAAPPPTDRRRITSDALELAGQLRLELDKAPEPGVLRGYWSRLDRLRQGVLWPDSVGRNLPDQGMREIVAIATAAQAFQVCTGAVTYSQTQKDSSTREASQERQADTNFKDLVNSLSGLAAGAFVGLGTYQSLNPNLASAAAAGIGAGLLTTLAMKWTTKQTLKKERTLDYSFILDRSKETLDRDLPLVIERIRDAGLAPVFVIDELDKLDDPDKSIEELIKRLKHLIADHGFFCFLTDRNYYEALHDRLRSEAYPPVYTYFSHWLFIHYRPLDLYRYLDKILVHGDSVEAGPSATQNPSPSQTLDKQILARFLVHRSKLSIVDALRELAKLCNPDGAVNLREGDLGQRPFFLLPLTLQLAFEHVIESSQMRERFEQEPYFAQIVVDILHAVSRDWEAGKEAFDFSHDNAVANALRRMDRHNGGDANERLDATGDLEEVIRSLNQFVSCVSDLNRLRTELLKKLAHGPPAAAELGSMDTNLVDAIPSAAFPSLVQIRGDSASFLFNRYGVNLSEPLLQEGMPLPRELADEIRNLLAFVGDFLTSLAALGLEVSNLVEHGILPPSISQTATTEANEGLRNALVTGRFFQKLPECKAIVFTFAHSVSERTESIVGILLLAQRVAYDATVSTPVSARTALSALARYLDMRTIADPNAHPRQPIRQVIGSFIELPDDFVPKEVSGTPAAEARSIHWPQDALSPPSKPKAAPIGRFEQSHIAEMWDVWAERLTQYLADTTSTPSPVTYREIVLAAQERWPGYLFRRELHQMTVTDWSELCLGAFAARRHKEPEVPEWASVAALRALGFGRDLLQASRELLTSRKAALRTTLMNRLALKSTVDRLLQGAGADRPGFVFAHRDANSMAEVPPATAGPCLAIRKEKLLVYDDLTAWLGKHNAIKATLIEREADSAATRLELPRSLKTLPAFEIARTPATSSDQSAEESVIYSVASLDDAISQATRRLDIGAELLKQADQERRLAQSAEDEAGKIATEELAREVEHYSNPQNTSPAPGPDDEQEIKMRDETFARMLEEKSAELQEAKQQRDALLQQAKKHKAEADRLEEAYHKLRKTSR